MSAVLSNSSTRDGDVATIPIRYDGRDADAHELELDALGESLRGVARIYAVTANFVVTGKYAKQYQALDVRVLVREPQANCYTIAAIIDFAREHQLFSGGAVATFTLIVQWIFARAANRREEMRHLKDSLDRAISEMARSNTELADRMMTTVEKMADALRPAVRQAVAPIGRTCSTMTLAGHAVVDEADAEVIRQSALGEVDAEREWTLKITELDLESCSAKVRLQNDEADSRIKARITDPAVRSPGNAYAQALSDGRDIVVRAKAIIRDGSVSELFVSNTVGDDSHSGR